MFLDSTTINLEEITLSIRLILRRYRLCYWYICSRNNCKHIL